MQSQLFGPGRFATTYALTGDDRYERLRASLGVEWAQVGPLGPVRLLAYDLLEAGGADLRGEPQHGHAILDHRIIGHNQSARGNFRRKHIDIGQGHARSAHGILGGCDGGIEGKAFVRIDIQPQLPCII